jgi:hypothetical protein
LKKNSRSEAFTCSDKILPTPYALGYGGPITSRGFHNCVMFAQEILVEFKTPRVLIVGFLAGYDLVYLLKCNVEAYGLELKIPNVKIIKENSVRASATHMPFKDKQFDWVLCSEVFEHLPMKMCKQILKEFKRVSNNYYLTIATRGDPPYNTHINIHDGEWWIKAIRDSGFGITHAELAQNFRWRVQVESGLIFYISKYKDGVMLYGSC